MGSRSAAGDPTGQRPTRRQLAERWGWVGPRPAEASEEARAAEASWRLVVDAQRDDLALLTERWPDRASPECVAAIDRLRRRFAAGGDADEALAAVSVAYGGRDRIPLPVWERLERYVWEQLGGRPWPERDLSAGLGARSRPSRSPGPLRGPRTAARGPAP
jgi:hypothetical protein